MIRFPTTQIGEDGLPLEGEEPGEMLELEQDPVARADGPVRYALHVEPAGADLVVRGEVEAPLRLRCPRCAQFFSTTVRVSSFLHAYEWAEHPESLDVTSDVREDVLLEIPGYALCDEACKGLCPQCGKNLNDGPCGCAPSGDALSPWGALDGLTDVAPPRKPDGGPDGPRP